jgi:DNA/RNA-binding domain of Phe-tRNA-synthetase-like protein
MKRLEVRVRFELQGWTLFMAELEVAEAADPVLSGLCRTVTARVRETRSLETLSADPTVAGLRRLFRAAGCDPTRYRPSSEALLRRLLKGSDMPHIHPLVDLNNCLSAELAVPCCVMAEDSFEPPFVLRAGRAGESYESLRGPFSLEGKPLLVDAQGPCDAPITGSQRVKVGARTERATLVAYLPSEVLGWEAALDRLEGLLVEGPVARLHAAGGSRG